MTLFEYQNVGVTYNNQINAGPGQETATETTKIYTEIKFSHEKIACSDFTRFANPLWSQ